MPRTAERAFPSPPAEARNLEAAPAYAFWAASLLFFCSGATGLAYEVIWFKRFSHVWGNSTLAMAAVVASFLFGLGVGARLLGRLADRVASPLWWYGVCEAGIGLLALAIPLALGLVVPLAAMLHEPLAPQPILYSLARFAITFAVIGPSCMLMGGTLPLLIRQFTPPGEELKRATAWLYGVNTLGAAAGCYLTGFHLLPSLGLQVTNSGTAGFNLLIGAVAIAVGRTLVPAAAAPELLPARSKPPSTDDAFPRGVVYSTALVTGTAALVLQVVWNRQLALILGGSTYAFTAMLFVILVGIGLGSLVHHALLRESRYVAYLPAVVSLLIIAATVLGQRAIPALTALVGTALPLRSSEVFQGILGAGASAALELLPALGMGVLFPLLVQLTRRAAEDAGNAVGTLYAWNTAGTIAGATATSLVFIPGLGTERTVTLALSLYALAALVLLPSAGLRAAAARLAVAGAAAGLLVLSAAGWDVDPRITNSGSYIYGYQSPETLAQVETLYFREGASCSVIVLQGKADGSRNLRVNGKADASDGLDMMMQMGSAYVSQFLRPRAKEILVIGFGSGTTAGASLQFPDTRVTCTEIEPAVFAASEHFAHVNHSPERSPRFSIVFDDGRSHLQGSDTKYDLILSEPSNPWIAGVSNLFTREFYEAARARLAPDGVLAQWIQTYSLTPASYAMIVKTVLSVFPHAGLVRLGKPDTLMLASMTPLEPTAETVAEAQALVDGAPTVTEDLRRWFKTTRVRDILTTLYVLDDRGLASLVAKHAPDVINTDGNMRLEYDAAQELFADDPTLTDTVYWNVMATASPERFAESFSRMGGSREEASIFHAVALDLTDLGLEEQATRVVELGLGIDPTNPKLLGDQLVLSPPEDRLAIEDALTRVLADSAPRATQVAAALGRHGRLDIAAELYERVLASHPDSATALKSLAVVYKTQGRLDLANEVLDRALALDPLDQAVLNEKAALARLTARPERDPSAAAEP
jgi:predicted membrane-bound spermidine synthase